MPWCLQSTPETAQWKKLYHFLLKGCSVSIPPTSNVPSPSSLAGLQVTSTAIHFAYCTFDCRTNLFAILCSF